MTFTNSQVAAPFNKRTTTQTTRSKDAVNVLQSIKYKD